MRILLALSIAYTLCACQPNSELLKIKTELSDTNKKIVELEKKLHEIDDTVLAQANAVNSSLSELHEFKSKSELKFIAYLKPDDEGYSLLHTDLGIIAVSLVDIVAYADGCKVKLSLGNTLSTDISGLNGKFTWSKILDNGKYDFVNAKSKDVTFTQTLKAGSWTTVTVILSGVQPSEFGFLKLSEFSHTGIKLLKQ